jgi:hypothetical protein
LVKAIIIDGSFVMGKDEPDDIDLIIILHPGHDYGSFLRPFEYNVLSRKRVRRAYGFDVVVTEEDGPEYADYVKFFAGLQIGV